MKSPDLAAFLRSRREALQPEDVGMTRGPRRRTAGLRREEVAELSGMSTDYYARLERGTGPQPSEQMAAAIARGLRLTLAERDHLFLLTGHGVPRRVLRTDHVSPTLMRVLDSMTETPAQIMSSLGETLVQTPFSVALLGDQTRFEGMHRVNTFRWYMDLSSRDIYPPEDHERHGRSFTADLRRELARQGHDSPAGEVVRRLEAQSEEFREVWAGQDVAFSSNIGKRIVNTMVGDIDVHCQVLVDPEQQQSILIFTAAPGSESNERLQLLRVLGSQRLSV